MDKRVELLNGVHFRPGGEVGDKTKQPGKKRNRYPKRGKRNMPKKRSPRCKGKVQKKGGGLVFGGTLTNVLAKTKSRNNKQQKEKKDERTKSKKHRTKTREKTRHGQRQEKEEAKRGSVHVRRGENPDTHR